MIAQDSGNRYIESHLAATLARLEADCGDPLLALEYLALAIRNYHDSGSTVDDPRVAGFAACSLTGSDATNRRPPSPVSPSVPSPRRRSPRSITAIAHLRDVLGDQTYESLARKGETMTTAEMATYAYDQIDQARAELNAVSK